MKPQLILIVFLMAGCFSACVFDQRMRTGRSPRIDPDIAIDWEQRERIDALRQQYLMWICTDSDILDPAQDPDFEVLNCNLVPVKFTCTRVGLIFDITYKIKITDPGQQEKQVGDEILLAPGQKCTVSISHGTCQAPVDKRSLLLTIKNLIGTKVETKTVDIVKLTLLNTPLTTAPARLKAVKLQGQTVVNFQTGLSIRDNLVWVYNANDFPVNIRVNDSATGIHDCYQVSDVCKPAGCRTMPLFPGHFLNGSEIIRPTAVTGVNDSKIWFCPFGNAQFTDNQEFCFWVLQK